MFEILVHSLGILAFSCLILMRGSHGEHGWFLTILIFAVPASKMLSLLRSNSRRLLWLLRSK